MKFSDIPSHADAKEKLRHMIDSNHIPHALLLEGPEGIGKFALARAAAQYLHCENRQDGDSCGKCPACLQHQAFNHIDTHFIFPVVNKDRISDDYIGEWREFLTESPFMDFRKWMTYLDSPNTQPAIYVKESEDIIHKLSFTSHRSRYKVVLMWLPERMRIEAANKLLKQIEEPFSDTIFILVSNNSNEILPTIYSRTQRIVLHRIPDNKISEYLTSRYPVSAEDAATLAHLAEGSLLRAGELVTLNSENKKFLALFIELMRKAYQRDVKSLKAWAADVSALGREQEVRLLTYCMRLIRENFIYNLHVSSLNYLNQEEKAFSANFARFVNERNVIQLMEELNKASIDIAGNANGKIVLFDLALRVILLLKA